MKPTKNLTGMQMPPPSLGWDNGKFYVEKLQCVMFPIEMLNLMKTFLPHEKHELYYIVKKLWGSSLERMFPHLETPADRISGLPYLGCFGGYCDGKFEKFDEKEKEAVIIGNNCFETDVKRNEKTCDIYRAAIAGGAEYPIGWKDIECVEVQCQSEGKKYCEFHIMPRSKIDWKDSLVKQQLGSNGARNKIYKRASKR